MMVASSPRCSVLIVDDHPEFGAFVHALLDAEGWNVVGEAIDAATAVAAVAELHPDLVLLDVQLPDGDGFGVAEQLARFPDPPRVVLMSSREASDYGSRLDTAAVSGFLPKHGLSGEALAAFAR